MVNNNIRYPALDGLRGLAALTVFFSHVSLMSATRHPLFDWLSQSIFHVFWDGAAAVVLFFVLSGFVLTVPYVGNSSRPIHVIPFIIRRVFRIYPAYFVAIVVSLFLQKSIFQHSGLHGLSEWINGPWQIFPSTRSLFNHLLLIGNIQPHDIDPVIWSLVIEMRISILFPFLLIVLQKAKTHLQLAFAIALSLIPVVVFRGFLFWAIFFLLGALLAYYQTSLIARCRNIPYKTRFLVGLITLFLYTSRFSIHGLSHSERLTLCTVGVGSALAILLTLSSHRVSRLLVCRPVTFLGEISYGFYLIHLPIILTVTSFLYPIAHSLVLCWVLSLIISIVFARGIYAWIELPFQRIGKVLAHKLTHSRNYQTVTD